ncbi:MAG: flagellar hook-associated protein FlgK [Rubrivivax sp.]
MSNALLSIGVRAMAASYAAMQTTGNNIANAGVDGYSRQITLLATAAGQATGNGYFGRGVNVLGVQRIQDAFLTREAAASKSLAAMDAVRNERLQQLQSVFKSGDQGIGNSISQFFSALSDLGSHPADSATRSVVLARAQDLAQRFNEAGTQLVTLQTQVNQELQSTVTAVNGLATSIAKVNQEIAAARGLDQEPNDLLDQRDKLISQLSEHVQVTTIAADDGSLGVFMGGGQRLVLGAVAEQLKVVPDTFAGGRSAVAITEGGNGTRTLSTDALGGGRIAGLLQFQNKDLVAAQTMLGQLSRALAGAVNAQQVLGLNLQPPAGSVASQPLFGFIASMQPQVSPASSNQKNGSGQYTSSVSIEIVDDRQLKATEYELREDPANAGQWQLLHSPDDGTAPISVVDGQQVDGFVIHFDSGPAAGERFLLQPVTRAAGGLQRLLSDPLALAAASPFVASADGANTGTAVASALTMASAPVDPAGTATVNFTGPAADPSQMAYTWELRDSGGILIGTGSGTWTPGQPIPSPPDADINGFKLQLAGVPAAGDSIAVQPTPYPANNNGNALALNALASLNLVGLSDVGGGQTSGGLSFTESFVAALADVGVRAQSAESSAGISAARATAAEGARTSKSGVNLDEEAANLIQFQQSYQAAAKVLQIAQAVFKDLLDLAG